MSQSLMTSFRVRALALVLYYVAVSFLVLRACNLLKDHLSEKLIGELSVLTMLGWGDWVWQWLCEVNVTHPEMLSAEHG